MQSQVKLYLAPSFSMYLIPTAGSAQLLKLISPSGRKRNSFITLTHCSSTFFSLVRPKLGSQPVLPHLNSHFGSFLDILVPQQLESSQFLLVLTAAFPLETKEFYLGQFKSHGLLLGHTTALLLYVNFHPLPLNLIIGPSLKHCIKFQDMSIRPISKIVSTKKLRS